MGEAPPPPGWPRRSQRKMAPAARRCQAACAWSSESGRHQGPPLRPRAQQGRSRGQEEPGEEDGEGCLRAGRRTRGGPLPYPPPAAVDGQGGDQDAGGDAVEARRPGGEAGVEEEGGRQARRQRGRSSAPRPAGRRPRAAGVRPLRGRWGTRRSRAMPAATRASEDQALAGWRIVPEPAASQSQPSAGQAAGGAGQAGQRPGDGASGQGQGRARRGALGIARPYGGRPERPEANGPERRRHRRILPLVITNAEIASLLYELARLTTLEEGSAQSFRVRAYEAAARAVEGHSEPLAAMSEAEIAALRGLGPGTARKIRELVDTGRIAKLDRLRAEFPPAFQELTRVSGVGPKTALALRDHLGVRSVADLKAAIDARALRTVPGLGAKSEENIGRAIERLGLGGKERRSSRRRCPAPGRGRDRRPVLRPGGAAGRGHGQPAPIPGDHRRRRRGGGLRRRPGGDHDPVRDPADRGRGGGSRGPQVGHRRLVRHPGGPAGGGAAPVRLGGAVLHRVQGAQHPAAAVGHRARLEPQRVRTGRGGERPGARLGHRGGDLRRPRPAMGASRTAGGRRGDRAGRGRHPAPADRRGRLAG